MKRSNSMSKTGRDSLNDGDSSDSGKKTKMSLDTSPELIVPQVDLDQICFPKLIHSLTNPDTVIAGTEVVQKTPRKAGPYTLGQLLGNSPVKSIVQCLARLDNDPADRFYSLKILTLPDDVNEETQDERQGRMLIHTEHTLLSILKDMEGVIQCHQLFKDEAYDEVQVPCERTNELQNSSKPSNKWIYTGKRKRRICLAMDCVYPHDFSPRSQEWINLQHYVIKEKKLTEKEAIRIFYQVVRVVSELHKRNIIHRDLKLGNMAFNRKLRKICLVNFCLGKQLMNDNDLLKDQRGSPAYISPDVLSAKPYAGKPSDMWALGVVLYTMIYGQFPFYDSVPSALFTKIKAADYTLPKDTKVSDSSQQLIKRLLQLSPKHRLTADQVLDILQTSIANWLSSSKYVATLQVVPDMENPLHHQHGHHHHHHRRKKITSPEKKSEESRSRSSSFSAELGTSSSSASGLAQLMSSRSRSPVAGGRAFPTANYGRVVLTNGRPSVIRTRTTPIGILPIHRINEEARVLSQTEVSQLRQIIMTRRHQSSETPRAGQPVITNVTISGTSSAPIISQRPQFSGDQARPVPSSSRRTSS